MHRFARAAHRTLLLRLAAYRSSRVELLTDTVVAVVVHLWRPIAWLEESTVHDAFTHNEMEVDETTQQQQQIHAHGRVE